MITQRALFVLYEPKFFQWMIPTVCYVWAGNEEVGAIFKSPHTKNVCQIILQSGNQKAAQWIHEERNYVNDYKECFGRTPLEMSAVAVMVDTDDTGAETTAWFDELILKKMNNSDISFTVIIPALNEARLIQKTIRTIRHINPQAQIIVVDGGSNDTTVTLSRKEGAHVVFSQPGRGIQCNAGLMEATGSVLLFLHADTLLPPNAFELITYWFTTRNAKIGTFRLAFDVNKHFFVFIQPSQNLIQFLRALEINAL